MSGSVHIGQTKIIGRRNEGVSGLMVEVICNCNAMIPCVQLSMSSRNWKISPQNASNCHLVETVFVSIHCHELRTLRRGTKKASPASIEFLFLEGESRWQRRHRSQIIVEMQWSDPQGHSQESLRDVCRQDHEITPGERQLANSCQVSM